ncbi:B-cell scaffold protein [Labeo rohita]|uniref:B-cell scaffold protein n=1 Tax=Labeo rohita TaxID=84645 RepID=A0A498LIA2_LABRO|nr:B-cell scaffold protein [Labeo rohita]
MDTTSSIFSYKSHCCIISFYPHQYLDFKPCTMIPGQVLDDNDGNTDTGVYEMMGRADNLQVVDPNEEHQNNEDENVYTPLGRDEEEYDTILTSSSSVVIVNRPPAPTPRPDSLPTPEDKTPFIAQARQRDSISSTYDTFVPSQPPGLDELIKLQEEVKMGSLSIDDALDRFNDWQRLQKGMDSIQQVVDMDDPVVL